MSDPATDSAASERIAAAIRAQKPGTNAKAVAKLARALFSKEGDAYASELGERAAAAVATHAYGFLAGGGPVPRVRVFTPSVAGTGWRGNGTVLESVMPDRPFIVDTIRNHLQSEGIEVRHLLHPLLGTEREPSPEPHAQGRLRRLHDPGAAAARESLVHAALEPVPADRLAALAEGATARLVEVERVTDDYAAMVAATEAVVAHLDGYKGRTPAWDDEVQEVQAFLRWLVDGGFVFLGYRSLALEDRDGTPTVVLDAESGLGILRHVERSHWAAPTPVSAIPEPVRSRLVGGPLLAVARTTAYAPVHHRARMAYVGVKKLDSAGRVRGEFRLLGLFTAKAYADEASQVPVLRRRLQQILQAEHVVPGSHEHGEVVAVFDSMPKAELLAMTADAIRADLRVIRAPRHAADVAVALRPDALERGVAVMVILPRDCFSEAMRGRIRETLAARLDGEVVDDHLALGDESQARLHFFVVAPRGRVLAVRRDDLQREIAELTRGWDDRLRERLVERHGAAKGEALAERYAHAFPDAYKAATDAAAAVADVEHFEALLEGAGTRIALANPSGGVMPHTALKLYLREPLLLSDIMPVLEDLGLRVLAEQAVRLPSLGDAPAYLETFFVQDESGARLDVDAAAERLIATVLAVRRGAVESDGLNGLVLSAGLSWQEVEVLRGYAAYAFQTGVAASRGTPFDALKRHPTQAALLVRWFAARFDPDQPRERAAAAAERFVQSLEEVQSIVEDRLLRALGDLVDATVRTNYYARLAVGAGDTVAVKIDCARVEHLPKPRPLFEIFVHGPRMEGCHLRAGRIARGGIRWSDRRDDFRTEVLGLMKTQTVKNAVIVPVGAKGGFVLKGGAGPDAVVAAYRTLIRALLDVTDNLVGDRVVAPTRVVCHDGPDPYLVVAADKGTATFSDVANGIAAEYGFWLGDAFASGGSHGYDHKKMGITARGTWECVTHHFRELDGRDVARDPTTVTGIGDLSGDVFGNAMLLSSAIKLRAAFDHRHVFLDPDPDPATSFAERQRLFALPRSSWADYRPDLLSRGGMVVGRATKTVRLSPEARQLLGIAAETVDGEQLVQAVLRAPTDLLFNGGIGTYVKAQGETNAQVGDTANAPVRVNASDLRCRVVGEGGNLGFTQRGRSEYALAGGRINTDAIDNSAGVDTSDHEVNLKIALQPLVASGALTVDARHRLLGSLADDVAALVLEHNRSQSRVLSRDQRRSETHLDEFRQMMVEFEASGLLDRALEDLPDRDTLRTRRATVRGLTRPELSVLLAYAKMHCTRLLVGDALCEDPYLEHVLFAYFPARLLERHADAVRVHRLRREIIATTLTNRLVDLMGAAFVTRTVRESGASAADVVRAFVVVDALADARALAGQAITAGPAAETALLDGLVDAVDRAVRWLLAALPGAPPLDSLIDRFREAPALVLRSLPERHAERLKARAAELAAAGAPAALAEACARVAWLRAGLDVAHVAATAGAAPDEVAAAYWGVGSIVDFDWLHEALDRAAGEDRWERRAAESLNAELHQLRRALAQKLLVGGGEVAARIATFRLRRAAALDRIAALTDDLRGARGITLPAIMVLVRELGRLQEGP